MTTYNDDSEFVRIPRRLADELRRWLDTIDDPNQPRVDVGDGNGFWDQAMVRRFRAEMAKYPAAMAVLDQAAHKAGVFVSLDEIRAEAEGIKPEAFRPQLATMSKVSKRLFGDNIWPITWVKKPGGTHYRMDETIAGWWVAKSK